MCHLFATGTGSKTPRNLPGGIKHRIDIDLPACLLRQRPHAPDMARRFLERHAARYRRKKRVAVSQIAKAWPAADAPAFMINEKPSMNQQ
jgi:hypothetical protein